MKMRVILLIFLASIPFVTEGHLRDWDESMLFQEFSYTIAIIIAVIALTWTVLHVDDNKDDSLSNLREAEDITARPESPQKNECQLGVEDVGSYIGETVFKNVDDLENITTRETAKEPALVSSTQDSQTVTKDSYKPTPELFKTSTPQEIAKLYRRRDLFTIPIIRSQFGVKFNNNVHVLYIPAANKGVKVPRRGMDHVRRLVYDNDEEYEEPVHCAHVTRARQRRNPCLRSLISICRRLMNLCRCHRCCSDAE